GHRDNPGLATAPRRPRYRFPGAKQCATPAPSVSPVSLPSWPAPSRSPSPPSSRCRRTRRSRSRRWTAARWPPWPPPRPATPSARYVAQPLALFKSGERNSGMAAAMIPFATPLSPQDMRDLGAFFATKAAGAGLADDSPVAGGPYDGMKFYEIGEKLYRAGDASRGVPACLACHGPAGAGNPGPAYPAVAGQEAAYVERRLQEYRQGTTSLQDRRLFDIMAQ